MDRTKTSSPSLTALSKPSAPLPASILDGTCLSVPPPDQPMPCRSDETDLSDLRAASTLQESASTPTTSSECLIASTLLRYPCPEPMSRTTTGRCAASSKPASDSGRWDANELSESEMKQLSLDTSCIFFGFIPFPNPLPALMSPHAPPPGADTLPQSIGDLLSVRLERSWRKDCIQGGMLGPWPFAALETRNACMAAGSWASPAKVVASSGERLSSTPLHSIGILSHRLSVKKSVTCVDDSQ